jgi:hypothetical protein
MEPRSSAHRIRIRPIAEPGLSKAATAPGEEPLDDLAWAERRVVLGLGGKVSDTAPTIAR